MDIEKSQEVNYIVYISISITILARRLQRKEKSTVSFLSISLHNPRPFQILGDEPEGSFERKIVDGSKESVQQLQDWVKTVEGAI